MSAAPETLNEWLRTVLFLPPQASTVSPAIDHLHYFVIITTICGATGVAVLAGYFIFKYRRRSTIKDLPREELMTTPLWAEALIVGGLFALFFGWWVLGFQQFVRIRLAPENSYDIYVTAKQWMWEFAYTEGNRTISELYVPAGRPVKLIMTSRDVIHSLFVPDFRLKEDVIPGRYTTLWFEAKTPGKHQIFCAEYCGTNHSTMRAEVIVLDPADFARWQGSGRTEGETHSGVPRPNDAEPSVATLLGPSGPMSVSRLGETVAAQAGCLRCHSLDGSPHIGPTWAGLFRSAVPLKDGGRAIADEAYLTESMMDPLAQVHAGYKPVMPSYLGRLQPAEVGAIVELIKVLRDRPSAPAPGEAEEGLPPPGVTSVPAARGEVEVGPRGQTKERP